MTKKKAARKRAPKKSREEVLKDWLQERVVPELLNEVLSPLKIHAEFASRAWPWASHIDADYSGIPGYSQGFDLNAGPGPGLRSGDVHMHVHVVVAVTDSDLLQLATLFRSLPTKNERDENEMQYAIGRLLCSWIVTKTDVSSTMQRRNASEAVGHAHRYATIAQVGLQLEHTAEEIMWVTRATKILFDSEGFLEIVAAMKKK